MKRIILKSLRAVRYLFYRHLSINEQIIVSETLNDEVLEKLFWKQSKADRHHSYEVFLRTKKFTNDIDILKLSLLHDIGKSIDEYSWIFRILTELNLIKNFKSKNYLDHEQIGLEILKNNNVNNDFINFYNKNLLTKKDEILDKTDF